MIISTSYKTDIPTFYGKWFLNRLNAGYCKMRNPYNNKVYEVKLDRENVDGFVFWTKNLGPFLKILDEVHNKGYPFNIQYSINDYPRELECSVVNWKKSIEHMKNLSSKYGDRVAVWRYDPILISTITPIDFHIKNFEKIAIELENVTDEVIISFAQIYKKTKRNLNQASREYNFKWNDLEIANKIELIKIFAKIANSHGMKLSLCSQRDLLDTFNKQITLFDNFDNTSISNVFDAMCIDAKRLSDVAGYQIKAEKKGHRENCGCYKSKDIGEYDTCPHGCIYCYAVQNNDIALTRFRNHDPKGEFLFK